MHSSSVHKDKEELFELERSFLSDIDEFDHSLHIAVFGVADFFNFFEIPSRVDIQILDEVEQSEDVVDIELSDRIPDGRTDFQTLVVRDYVGALEGTVHALQLGVDDAALDPLDVLLGNISLSCL